jgi:hypothetical protein
MVAIHPFQLTEVKSHLFLSVFFLGDYRFLDLCRDAGWRDVRSGSVAAVPQGSVYGLALLCWQVGL